MGDKNDVYNEPLSWKSRWFRIGFTAALSIASFAQVYHIFMHIIDK